MAKDGKPPYFNREKVERRNHYRNIGRVPERPFMILGTLLETSLGDLLSKIVFLATIKEHFDHARLIVRYRDLRPYSRDAISLAPNIDHATALKGERPEWLAKWLPDTRPWLPLTRWTLSGDQKQDAFYDLVVVESMMNARNVDGFSQPALLRVPPERVEPSHQQLIGLGLDPDRWYATIHYRTHSYGPKRNKSPIRNSDPENYRKLRDYIIDELGGQVVQLGHPEMVPFAPRPGFVDLSRIAGSFITQAYAVCHSRFMLAGPSGPQVLSSGFQVPFAYVDATDGIGSWGNVLNVLVTHEVTTPDGRVLRGRELHESGLLEYGVLFRKIRDGEKFTVRKNSGAELSQAARFLFDQTTDVTGWRPIPQRPAKPRPNQLIWPPQTRENENLRFLGE